MLTEKTRTTQVSASAETETHKFAVTYEFTTELATGNVLKKINVNVSKKATQEEPERYVGIMNLENNQKTIAISDAEQLVLLTTPFETIIAEIKQSLVPAVSE